MVDKEKIMLEGRRILSLVLKSKRREEESAFSFVPTRIIYCAVVVVVRVCAFVVGCLSSPPVRRLRMEKLCVKYEYC